MHPDAVTPQDRLYREYGRNCSDTGRPTISKTGFGPAMKKLRPKCRTWSERRDQEAENKISGTA
ncbi:MAG: hypothetical protein HY235_24375 [Acidobacteria bacterium]|nr:hypothetical protein [Acidobacteriota bacterium]